MVSSGGLLVFVLGFCVALTLILHVFVVYYCICCSVVFAFIALFALLL